MKEWTIQKLLNWITQYLTDKKIDTPRLNAEMLLSSTLEMQRIELYTNFDKPVAPPQLNKLHKLVKRAGENEPSAYIIGKTEFYSLEINVNKNCLIPRPETELLTERAIEFLREKSETKNENENENKYVCDLCTGSGCVAIAIAKNQPNIKIIATDISDAALTVAAENIEKYKLADKIALLCGDLFEPLIPQLDEAKFDLIVCNPPYVSDEEFEKLDKNVKDYEPKAALLAGKDGLDIYKRIAGEVNNFLKPGAALIMEIGCEQAQAVRKLLEKTGVFGEITIEKDFQNHDRIVTAKHKS